MLLVWSLVAIVSLAPLAASSDQGRGSRVLAGVTSVHEMKWEGVVRQRIEVGCGAASLATIMTYYFGFPTTEQELADAMFVEAEGDGQATVVKQIGFSMSHIRRVAEKGGLVARGFRVPIEQLDRIKIPVIAQVTIRGYQHFLVFKSAQDGRIFVADPAFGNGSYRLSSFENIWSGVMIGFIRQGDNPRDHQLIVKSDPSLGEIWERVTERSRDAARFAGRPATTAFNFSTLPETLDRIVPGLESVFPRFLTTRTRF